MPLDNLTADVFDDLEPQRMNQFRLVISNLPGGDEDTQSIVLALQNLPFPQENTEPVEIMTLNEKRTYAGRTTFEGGSFSLIDFINRGVMKAVKSWRLLVYNPENGKVGLKKDYAKEARIYLYAPNGSVERIWRLVNIWPTGVNWGQGDMTSSDKVTIEVTFVYDKAFLEQEGPVTPTPGTD